MFCWKSVIIQNLIKVFFWEQDLQIWYSNKTMFSLDELNWTSSVGLTKCSLDESGFIWRWYTILYEGDIKEAMWRNKHNIVPSSERGEISGVYWVLEEAWWRKTGVEAYLALPPAAPIMPKLSTKVSKAHVKHISNTLQTNI